MQFRFFAFLLASCVVPQAFAPPPPPLADRQTVNLNNNPNSSLISPGQPDKVALQTIDKITKPGEISVLMLPTPLRIFDDKHEIDNAIKQVTSLFVSTASCGTDRSLQLVDNKGHRPGKHEFNAVAMTVATLEEQTKRLKDHQKRANLGLRSESSALAVMEVGAVIAKIASATYQQQKRLPSPAEVKRFLSDHTNLQSWLPGSVPHRPQYSRITTPKGPVEIPSGELTTLKREGASLQGTTRRHIASIGFHSTPPGTDNGQLPSSSGDMASTAKSIDQPGKPRITTPKGPVEVPSGELTTLKRKASASLLGTKQTAPRGFHNTPTGTYNGQLPSSSGYQGSASTLAPVQIAGYQASATTLPPVKWNEWLVEDYGNDQEQQPEGTHQPWNEGHQYGEASGQHETSSAQHIQGK
ncbi:hypothetical protein H0H93_000235 [Arthromyces matolae]|nr:hypothetical protein H0H93_000235 [Arthromyces matolae]